MYTECDPPVYDWSLRVTVYCHVSVSSLWLIHRTGSSSAWLAVSSYSEVSRNCWFCGTFRCLLWFSGHDTTTSGVCWTLYLLAKHPECQQRCQREIDALLEGRQNGDLLWWGVAPPTTPPPLHILLLIGFNENRLMYHSMKNQVRYLLLLKIIFLRFSYIFLLNIP